MTAPLTCLSLPPRISSPHEPPVLLLLHGFGDNEADMLGYASYLDPRLHAISLRAPLTLKPGAYAWSRAEFTPSGPADDACEMDEGRIAVIRFMGEVDADRVLLMGFSQGAAIALGVALTAPERLAGAVALSGRVLPEYLPGVAPDSALAGLPILVTHGTEDRILPIRHARASRDALADLPVDLTYREYAAGHEVTAAMLADVREWMAERLAA